MKAFICDFSNGVVDLSIRVFHKINANYKFNSFLETSKATNDSQRVLYNTSNV